MVDVPQVSQPNALANLQSLATIGQNFGRDQYYNALAQKDQAASAQAEQLRGLDPSTFQTPEGYAKLFAASPDYALKVQQHFDIQSDKEQKNLLRAAPITAGVLSLVNDQDTYDRAMTELKRQGVDTSDFPKQYDPKAVGFALAGTRHLSEGFAPTAEGGITNAPGFVQAKAAQQFGISKAAAAGNLAAQPAPGPDTGPTSGWVPMTLPAHTDAQGNAVPEQQIVYNANAQQGRTLGGQPIDAATMNNIAKLSSKPAGDLPDPSSPAVQAQVQALLDGRMQFPTSFAASKPYWQEMYKLVAEQDPNFDAINYNTRTKTRAAFANGQEAKNLTAIGTAMGHAANLADKFAELGNYGGIGTALNAPANFFSEVFGSSKVTNAREAISALASESRKVFATTGGGGLEELRQWEKNFPINGSPEQQQGALKELVDLYDSRIHSLGSQYNRGMGTTKDPLELLDAHGQAAYRKLTGADPMSVAIPGQGQRAAPAATGPAAVENPYASLSDDQILKQLGIR